MVEFYGGDDGDGNGGGEFMALSRIIVIAIRSQAKASIASIIANLHDRAASARLKPTTVGFVSGLGR